VKDRLAKKGYKTLIDFVCEGDVLKCFPPAQRPFIYIVGHFIGSVLAMIISIVWWKYELAHFGFSCFLFFSMIYAGGYHYYEVYFAKIRKMGVQQGMIRFSMYQVGTDTVEKITSKEY